MNSIVAWFKGLVERSAFGVCSELGDRMGVASSKIRMFFIYASLLTLGSPIIFYLFYVFWMNLSAYIRSRASILWE